MYRDKTLIPTEAIRLCALGIAVERPVRYADMSRDVRHFAARVAGPSLDLLGPSLELLRYEGLVEAIEDAESDNALLAVTAKGREEFLGLLRSRVRTPVDDVNKLVIALKFRFLHLLAPEDRQAELEGLVELFHSELARLEDLREGLADEEVHLAAWLDHDVAQLRARIGWLEAYAATV